MKKFIKEFKEFALKGNVLDMAIGVIIGGAFSSIVTSLTGDVISPLLGIFVNNDFANLSVNISGSEIKYGAFITAIINFIIMALIVFIFIKLITRTEKAISKIAGISKEEASPTTKKCPYCLSEIPIEASRCSHCTSHLEK